MFGRSPQLAQAICSDESLIEKAVRNKAKQGGCCRPVEGDTTGNKCQTMDRDQFTTCCQNACDQANSQYGCSLDCKGKCGNMSNPFFYPGVGIGVGGQTMFNECLKFNCDTTDCDDVSQYAKVEPLISDCCTKFCRESPGCILDCQRLAQNKLGGDPDGGRGGPSVPAGGNGTPGGPSPKTPKKNGDDSWFEKNKTAVYIFLGLAALVVLIVILFSIFKKPNKKGKK